MGRNLPAGTVTFLFTDVEGSTRLLDRLGADGYAAALAAHRRVLRDAFAAHGGVEVDTQGDAFFAAFPTAPGALAAARDATAGLAGTPIRVRAGIHTGTPLVTDEGYVGADVHRAARIAACGHGGQVLVSAATAALAGTDGLTDLGAHRLKDLSAPERIYQLGGESFPPLRSLHRTNLPVAATPFLGREKELPEVVSLLARDDVRALTLTGPGGTGKTRLAMQAAALASERYPQGVWWVPLAPLRDPALVLETAARALGARGDLADHVGDDAVLLLLDNFEHLVGAAADVSQFLARCPNAAALVTSREPLRIAAEHEYAVPPLVRQEAAGFFLARARAVDASFEADGAVAEICRLLDDLPLALELAAARVKVLSPAQIVERLDRRLPLLTTGARDLPERQRTLRATIDWSYELLEARERALFARLAVFRGGATLDDAEHVVGADVDTLAALVDKSLLRHAGERFWMLETIREYAHERLAELSDAGGISDRHAERFAALAAEAAPHVVAFREKWLERLEAEHDNLRAAFDHYEAAGDTQRVLALVGSLSRFWFAHGHNAEGRRRAERALAADASPTAARASALIGYALLAGSDRVRHIAEEAIAIAAAVDDPVLEAIACGLLASSLLADDIQQSIRLYAEAIEVLRERDVHWAMVLQRSYAYAYELAGDLARSRELHEQNLADARLHGNRRIEAVTLGALSMNMLETSGPDAALPLLREAVVLHRALGDPLEASFDLNRIAAMLAATGNAAETVALATAAEALRDELGAPVGWASEMGEAAVAAVRGRLDDHAYAAAVERGRALSWEDAVALGFERLGR